MRYYSGNPNFALPYWDYWNNGKDSQLALPSPFLRGSEYPNLFHSARNDRINNGAKIANDLQYPSLDPRPALAEAVFTGSANSGGFGGQFTQPIPLTSNDRRPTRNDRKRPHAPARLSGVLEYRPHNAVHRYIGRDMGNPSRAARDPIFWLHHANIDRLWAKWNEDNDQHQNPTDAAWAKEDFFFYDFDGTNVREVVVNGSEMTSLNDLCYQYEHPAEPQLVARTEARPVARRPAARQQVVQADVGQADAGGQPFSLGLQPVHIQGRPATRSTPTDAMATETRRRFNPRAQYRLWLDGIRTEDDPPVSFAVLLNAPDDIAVRGDKSLYYAGELTLFAAGSRLMAHMGHAHDHSQSIYFDVTDSRASILSLMAPLATTMRCKW